MSAITLQPQENFTIVRVLGDHTDSTTYYVRATIFDSLTGATIAVLALAATIPLPRRFTKVWQVIADTSGLGRYIDILTEVFTDVGFTTKAGTYSDESDSYLIFDRFLRIGGGSSGPDVDYKKITKIFKASLPEPEKPQKIDLKPISEALQSLQTSVKSIKVPEAEKIDFGPVMAKMDELGVQIHQSELAIIDEVHMVEIPDPKNATDLSPVLEKMDAMKFGDVAEMAKKMLATFEQLSGKMDSSMPGMQTNIETIEKSLKDFLYVLSSKMPEKTKPPSALRVRGKK